MKTAALVLPLLVSSLIACNGGGGGGGSSSQSNAYQGVWTSSVSGESYELRGNQVRVYEHNSRFCLLADEITGVTQSELQNTFALSDDRQRLEVIGSDGTSELHAPIVYYSKVEALPANCDTPITTIGNTGYQRNPVRDLDLFGQTFSDFYLSFDLKQVDWQTAYQNALDSVSMVTTDEELMQTLISLIQPLRDTHVSLSSETLGEVSVDGKPTLIARLINEYISANELSEPLMQFDIDAINDYVEEQLELRNEILFSYADDGVIHSAANDELLWYSVGDIAYLYIGSMEGFSDNDDADAELQALELALDRVIEDIQDSEGLIIDVRSNNGGRDFLSMAIASRFVSGETLAFSKQTRDGHHRTELENVYVEPRGDLQYLKPVVLLTSNSTVSAAEVFTLIMRALPNVTLMGESTQGGLSDALEKTLPNGFRFTLSNQFYFSSEGEWFEDVGIPVDIEVPFFSLEERMTESDLGLESAYTLLVDE